MQMSRWIVMLVLFSIFGSFTAQGFAEEANNEVDDSTTYETEEDCEDAIEEDGDHESEHEGDAESDEDEGEGI